MADKNDLVIIRDYHLKSEEQQKHYDAYVTQLASKMRDLVGFMDRTFFLFSWVLESPTVTKNKNVRDVLHLLLSRSLKSYKAIQTLMASGLEQDGLAILRNLIETLMTIKYISSDSTGDLAQRFREYQDIERYKNMQKNRRSDPQWLPPGGDVEAKRLEAARDAFKAKYKVTKTASWHGFGGLEELAGQPGVDMVSDYVQAYSTFCLLTHPSYLSNKEYSPDPMRNPFATWAPTARKALELTCLSTGYLIKVVETYVDHLGITDPQIQNVLNEVRSNLLAQNKMGPWAPGKMTVEVKGGQWGTLPASLQGDLKSTTTS